MRLKRVGVISDDGNTISFPALIDRIGSMYYDVVTVPSPAPSSFVVSRVACGTRFVVCLTKRDLVSLCIVKWPNHEHCIIRHLRSEEQAPGGPLRLYAQELAPIPR